MIRGAIGAVALAFVLAVMSLASARDAAANGPVLVVSPMSLDFSTVTIGAAAAQTLTIRNAGAATLNLSTPVVQTGSEAGFSVTAPGELAVVPGGATTVTVRFTPAAAGRASGTVLIGSTDGETAVVALTGEGVAPPEADTTPPTLSGVPDSLTVDATSPDGAIVTWAEPTATDAVSGSVPVTCAPASGSTFAIGTTRVECSATDEAHNTATASFDVTVLGAAAQLERLLDTAIAFSGGTLPPDLRQALVIALNRLSMNQQASCLVLQMLATMVRATPARIFDPSEKARLLEDIARIRAVIAC
jgi:hypothetical protein